FQRYQTVEYEKYVLLAKPPKPMPPLTHTNYDIEWLMICQHYGIPTRLIDWSTDILIALFFACHDETYINNDGAIFICNQNDYPIFTAYNEHIMEAQKLAFVSTNVINPRMRTQSGNFMMWGHAPLDDNTTESYDLWEYQEKQVNSHFLKKIFIPKNSKRIILREMKEIYSITFDSIYLDNGFLERTFSAQFEKLKENARLMTLYTTDADRLSESEEKIARSMFKNDCRNMFGGCVRLSKIR
ncbi:MAG: FRG domain-containing protein, partial [Bacteroidales bacterium]|nr:FRG domain-containing protein [Bacteroidales bacterium]